MEDIQPTPDVPARQTRSMGRVLPGLILALPALFCCISQLLLPTLGTFSMSFQEVDLFGSEAAYVGLENYAHLFGDEGFWQAAGFTLLMLLVRLFAAALIPLVLAWAVSDLGRGLRLGLRVLLTLPIVFFIPAAVAIAWLLFLNPANGLSPFDGSWIASPGRARSTLLFIDALSFLGLASGLGLMLYLPLWRRSTDAPARTFQEVLKPVLGTWAVSLLGIIALTLSTFTLNYVLTNGGPARSTRTLGILLFDLAFRNFNIGPAAAMASLILLITLGSGLAAGFLILQTRLRLDVIDPKPAIQPPAHANSTAVARIVIVLLILLMLVACLLQALPFGWLLPQALGGEGLGPLLQDISPGSVFANSLVIPLVNATLQVGIAYLAALGIGALQPFGKRSEWLLLIFSPWLFVGVLPLSLVNFLADQEAGRLDTLSASFSPILFSVPALFLLTLFFAGRASQLPGETREGEAQAAPGFFEHFIRPSLPLATTLWLLCIFINGQELFWPLLVSVSPERYTLNLLLIRQLAMFGAANATLAAAISFLVLPVCVFFFICLALLQVFALDRLMLYSENPSTEAAGKTEQS